MKALLRPIGALVAGLGVLTSASGLAMDYYAKDPLSPACTKELGEYYNVPIKVVLVIHQDGQTTASVPYGTKPISPSSLVKFPLKVEDIAEEPDVFTLIKYHATPEHVLFCWWDSGGRHCI
jgi:hypothetical protein